MKNQTYCAGCGRKLKPNNRRTSPIGRHLVVCESCRRKQAKALKAKEPAIAVAA